ncbi:MAG TPA: hypothetical protein VNZ58_10080 [Thermomicrobiales bacterium]|nr:hypothetical protein [Thermomicrobiales bacterium]
MTKGRIVTSIESLDAIMTSNAELLDAVNRLRAELEARDAAIADLRDRLSKYWDLHESVDYRGLVDQIRDEAKNVGDLLRSLDMRTLMKLARIGSAPEIDSSSERPEGLLPSVNSLLQTLNKWK